MCQHCKPNQESHPVIVAYMPVRGGSERRYYLACSRSDCTALWPNFTKAANNGAGK